MQDGRAGQPPQLKRVLTALLGVAIVVGGTIGVGILRTPGTIAGDLGSVPLILGVWLLGGLIAMLGANPYAELATALPKAGGPFVYAERAFGPSGGALVGWADFAISITSQATFSVTIAEYALPAAGFAPVHGAALALLLGFGTLNWFGLKVGAGTQQWLSLAKVGGLVGLALAALAFGFASSEPAPVPVRPTELPSLLAAVAAIVIVCETYGGWNSAVYFSEEDQDAARNVPRALFWGIVAITLTYLLFNGALLALVPIGELAAAKLPAANLAERLFGAAGSDVVRLFALVSLCGILNVNLMSTPRILFGMGRAGYAPTILSRVNAHGAPGAALIATLVSAMVLAATLDFTMLFAITAFLGLAVNLACYLAFFALRRKEPELPRPYLARGYPWLPGAIILITSGLLLLFVLAEPMASAIAASILVAGWLLALRGTRSR